MVDFVSIFTILMSSKGLSSLFVLAFSIFCTTSAPFMTCRGQMCSHGPIPVNNLFREISPSDRSCVHSIHTHCGVTMCSSMCPCHLTCSNAGASSCRRRLTLPNTVCLPSSQGVGTVEMKNWEPFVLGPELAIDSVKGLSWRREGLNSSSNSRPHILLPPVPSPASIECAVSPCSGRLS